MDCEEKVEVVQVLHIANVGQERLGGEGEKAVGNIVICVLKGGR